MEEYKGKHAGAGPVRPENPDYVPKHAKAEENPWEKMAEEAPDFDDSKNEKEQGDERVRKIVEKWDSAFEECEPRIVRNEEAYDELVDEMLFCREVATYDIPDAEKGVLATRKVALRAMQDILERGALQKSSEHHAYEERADGTVILRRDSESFEAFQKILDSTQESFDAVYNTGVCVDCNNAQDEYDLVMEGEVRGSHDDIPAPYKGKTADALISLSSCEADNPDAKQAVKELETFLFKDKDRNTHLRKRVKLLKTYNELNECYLAGGEK